MADSTAATKPSITLLVVTGETQHSFIPEPLSGPGVYPCLLDADNLRSAATQSSRLAADKDGNIPLPLLRIRTHEHPGTTDAIPFSAAPRLLAGLIADAVRASVALGAVVTICQNAADPQQLHQAISEYLHLAGFGVTDEVPGWNLAKSHPSTIGNTPQTSAA